MQFSNLIIYRVLNASLANIGQDLEICHQINEFYAVPWHAGGKLWCDVKENQNIDQEHGGGEYYQDEENFSTLW